MFLNPHPDRNVPDPDRGGFLPVDGRDVVPSTYWQRRLEDGDVEAVDPPAEPAGDAVQTSALTKSKAKAKP